MLAIYPYEPLPDLAFHAPLLPKYPDGAAVEEDATLGCHQGAFYPPSNAHPQLMASCKLSEHRVLAFLETCGVKLPSKSAACARESCALAEQALRHTIKSSRASQYVAAPHGTHEHRTAPTSTVWHHVSRALLARVRLCRGCEWRGERGVAMGTAEPAETFTVSNLGCISAAQRCRWRRLYLAPPPRLTAQPSPPRASDPAGPVRQAAK